MIGPIGWSRRDGRKEEASGILAGIQGQGWPGSDMRIEDGQRVGTGVWSASGADFAMEESHTGAIREVV